MIAATPTQIAAWAASLSLLGLALSLFWPRRKRDREYDDLHDKDFDE